MKIKRLILLSLFIGIIFSGCSTIEKYKLEQKQLAPPNENTVHVALDRHQDCDTSSFKIKEYFSADTTKGNISLAAGSTINVRYIGINCPESMGQVEYLGPEASEFTEQQLLNSEEIILEIDGNAIFDNHSRLLAHVFVDGESLQKKILEKGYGKTAYLYDEYKYIDEYRAAEDQARASRLNIYSIDGYATKDTNGYNMDVVKPEVLARESLSELEENFEKKLIDKAVDVLTENLFQIQLIARSH